MSEAKSLDQIDRELFAPGPSPLAGPARTVEPEAAVPRLTRPGRPTSFRLMSNWEMVAGGDAHGGGCPAPGPTPVPAVVPGSVQTALLRGRAASRPLCRSQ